MQFDTSAIIRAFGETADAIGAKVSAGLSWEERSGHKGQHQGDVEADSVGVEVLTRYGFDVFSEESGFTSGVAKEFAEGITVVVDPIDGSTNASKKIPFYAVSLCAVAGGVPIAGFVRNLVSGDTYVAELGKGSKKNGRPITPSAVTSVSKAVVGLNGYSEKYLGWAQCRSFGSAALELCMVAEGSLDGYADFSKAALASWDILGGLLICQESGAVVMCEDGGSYNASDLQARKRIVAAGTMELAESLRFKAFG